MSAVALGTALAAAAAVWLSFPSSRVPRSPGGPGGGPLSDRLRAGSLRSGAALGVLSGALTVVLDGTTLVLALICLAAAAGGRRAVLRARARRAADAHADRVLELCEVLAGELRAGQPPRAALRRCVEAWPAVEPVAAAAELGSDVPQALRRLARLPGAVGLEEVAAAWQVSERSGATMALALARVADSARRRRATQRLVAAELASAQATARLVAVLPALVLTMGAGLGGEPWVFLLTTTAGLCCLAVGLALALAGLAWIDRIAASVVGR